jgi:hypothetical protein
MKPTSKISENNFYLQQRHPQEDAVKRSTASVKMYSCTCRWSLPLKLAAVVGDEAREVLDKE